MKSTGLSLNQVLDIMAGDLRNDLTQIRTEGWGIKTFDQIRSLMQEDAVVEAQMAYKATLRENPLDEGGYWDRLYRTAGRKLLWAVFQFELEKPNQGIPLQEEDLRLVYDWEKPQAIMDRGSRLDTLAEKVFASTSITPEIQTKITEEQKWHQRERF